MSLSVDEVRERASRVRATAPRLRAMDDARLVSALAMAAERLRDPETTVGRSLRTAAARTSGLSDGMIAWALSTTLRTATPAHLEASLAFARGFAGPGRRLVAPGLLSIVLAGNVFTAGFRAVAWPLLLRLPVVVKASSRDDVFVSYLRAALAETDDELAESFDVLTFAGEEGELLDALLASSDVVSVYGSDRTVGTIRGRCGGSTGFVAHGHGLGAAYVPADALSSEAAAIEVARRLALDVAAYDQRGCLSPHTVWVERGGEVEPQRFAELLSEEGLAPLAESMPRGALPVPVGAQQLQWRGVGTVRGTLFEGNGWAVAFEGDGVFRVSPGYRNVQVIACDGVFELGEALRPLGPHLKTLGVAGDETTFALVLAALPPPLAPRISPVGTMQTPPFDAAVDGELPFTGLVRLAELG